MLCANLKEGLCLLHVVREAFLIGHGTRLLCIISVSALDEFLLKVLLKATTDLSTAHMRQQHGPDSMTG